MLKYFLSPLMTVLLATLTSVLSSLMAIGSANAQTKYHTPMISSAANDPALDQTSFDIGKSSFTRMTDLWGYDTYKYHVHLLPSICLQDRAMIRTLNDAQSTALKWIQGKLSKENNPLWAAMHASRHRLIDHAHHVTRDEANKASCERTAEAKAEYYSAIAAFNESDNGKRLRKEFESAESAFDSSPDGLGHRLIRIMEHALRSSHRLNVKRCTDPLNRVADEDLASAEKSLQGIKSPNDFVMGWLAGLDQSTVPYRLGWKDVRKENADQLDRDMDARHLCGSPFTEK